VAFVLVLFYKIRRDFARFFGRKQPAPRRSQWNSGAARVEAGFSPDRRPSKRCFLNRSAKSSWEKALKVTRFSQGGTNDCWSLFAACSRNLCSRGHLANRPSRHEATSHHRADFYPSMGELGCLRCRDYPGMAWLFCVGKCVITAAHIPRDREPARPAAINSRAPLRELPPLAPGTWETLVSWPDTGAFPIGWGDRT
jgi:hypothetical protein